MGCLRSTKLLPRRSARPRTSTFSLRLWLLLWTTLLLQIAPLAAANRHHWFQPIRVGIHRGLRRDSRSESRRQASSTAAAFASATHNRAQTQPPADEQPIAIDALLREHDAPFIKQASYAVRRQSTAPSTEWEHLKSIVPCALVIDASALSASPRATNVSSSEVSRVAAGGAVARPLAFWENMICGAISRSIAQTVMHPANTMKTILQSSTGPDRPTFAQLVRPNNFRRLTVGAGANFLLSVPHGAVNFAVLEFVRKRMQHIVDSTPFLKERAQAIGPGLDFLSSAVSTISCSVVSTPQMMITDNIMAGNYPNLPAATRGLHANRGVMGFYAGWWPGLVGKIPSYGLTWTLFQGLKKAHARVWQRPARDLENSAMGCLASATTVCIMIPMDTIKTRLVIQTGKAASERAYKGIVDCAIKIVREEGFGAFYRGLTPRLVSVVPMIGIQFGVYEAMKKVMLQRGVAETKHSFDEYDREEVFREATMEVAASLDQPYPAPQFLKRVYEKGKKKFRIHILKLWPDTKST